MEIFTFASAFFLKVFVWFSAATLVIQTGVVVGVLLAVAAFVGLAYKLATHSKYKAYNQIPQNIKDAYYEPGPNLSQQEDSPPAPPLETSNQGRRFKPNRLYYNQEDGINYFDKAFTKPCYKSSQAEIDTKKHVPFVDGIVAFAEQYKKSRPGM